MTQIKKRTKVLLVYPMFPSSFWSFKKSMDLLGLGAVMPPTGLATIAAMLPNDFFDCMPIIDMNITPLTDQLIAAADLVMISSMITQRASFEDSVARIKKLGKTIVAGGPYPTSYRQEAASAGVDHLVLNEAELTLPPFINDWLTGNPLPLYDETNARCSSSAILSKEGKPMISTSPNPRWDLLDLWSYSSMAVQYSRGCPHNCEFCDITTLFGHIPRTKSVDQFIAEIESIYATGWRGSIFIVDDNFIGNRRNVRQLLPRLISWQESHGFPFSFYTEASLDLATDSMEDIRQSMVEAGFEEVFCGIESTDPEVLAGMNKGQNRGNLADKIDVLHKSGLEVTGGFIIGSDNEQTAIFDNMYAFIQQNGIVIAMVGLLTALRNTPLYSRLKNENRIRSDTSGNNTHRFRFNFRPMLNERLLVNGYVDLLSKLYSPKSYFERCRILGRRLVRNKRKIMVNRNTLLAVARILCLKLFVKPDFAFARHIFGTLFSNPKQLGTAFKQAIKFAHFEQITRTSISAYRYQGKIESLTKRFLRRITSLSGNTDKRLQKLAILEKEIIAKGLRYYNMIDPDFRSEAEIFIRSWQKRIHLFAMRYRLRWQAAPISSRV